MHAIEDWLYCCCSGGHTSKARQRSVAPAPCQPPCIVVPAERCTGRPAPGDFGPEAWRPRRRGQDLREDAAGDGGREAVSKQVAPAVERAASRRPSSCSCGGVWGVPVARHASGEWSALLHAEETPNLNLATWPDVVLSRLVVNGEGKPIALRYEDLRDLLEPVWLQYIRSYAELRIYFAASRFVALPPPLGMHHTVVLLDLGDCGYNISVEKFHDSLELMIGERVPMRAHVSRVRATGARRTVPPGCSIQLEPSVALGPDADMPPVCVGDLFHWILGPVRKAWRPYNLVYANCQHFAGDLQQFLHGDDMVNLYPITL